ncbi:hypothetical protein N0V83_007409 [Neocucurbitaria cava]|uniref:TM7S3/TM198-like domain-containing protein n=1 Tax=Neocucurbitaria cava TaxID=798079 RepID=A0A9W8Y3B3_9PLEO|nr:hypothetical protein N0V83_007409 [Neocucurbitaria cava]
MNPPVTNAIQGAFFVAAFFTGLIFGVLSLVFSDITEGFGCLLGGFCLSMWFLSLKNGGLISSTAGRAIFIGCMSAGGYSLSFSHYTRNHGLISSIAFSGATATLLGIDCLAGAGWKEFWLYLWNLNDDVFPLNTNTYPLTKNIKAELAGVVIIAAFGVVSQMRVWKLVKEHRTKSAAQQLEKKHEQDREEEELGRKIEDRFQRERAQWEAAYGEAAYGDRSRQDSSIRSSVTSPKGSTSIREIEVYGYDSLEMVDMSKGGRMLSTNTDTPAEATVTVRVLKDDDIQPIDTQGNPIVLKEGQRSADSKKVLAKSQGNADSNGTPPIVTTRSSLHPHAPPPPPPVVPLPFKVPEEEGVDSEEDETTSVSVLAEAEHEADGVRRAVSKRISDMAAMRHGIPRDMSESQEALINIPVVEDDRASSVAATLDYDHEDVQLRQLSPPHSPVPPEHETLLGPSNTVGADLENVPTSANPQLQEKPSLMRNSPVPADVLGPGNPGSREYRVESSKSEAQSQDSQTHHIEPHVSSLRDHVLPERLSKVALSYRVNEWTKHLGAAEKPALDELPLRTSPSVILEATGESPAPVSDELASSLMGSRQVSRRVSAESRTGNSGLDQSTSTFSQDPLIDQRATTRSPPVVSSGIVSRSNSGTRLDTLSPLPGKTLMGRRETLMKNRISSQSLTPHTSSANFPAEPIVQEDDMTLAQRRQLLQHRSSLTSQTNVAPSASQNWMKKGRAVKGVPAGFDSHQPRRTSNSQSDQKREQLYAGWRDKMRDVTPPQTAAYIAEQQRVALMKERRQKEIDKQQRELIQQQRASQIDSMMRSGHMLDAHREAMRKMQANANKHA